MNMKKAFMAGIACVSLLSACKDDKNSKRNAADESPTERWNPEDVDGSFVAIGPWTLRLPTSDKLKSYYWEDDESLSRRIESSDIEISAVIDSNGTTAKFITKFVKDQCANFKTTPASDEFGGQTANNINWFVKNNGSDFESFSATAKEYGSCISMTIRAIDKAPALASSSDVIRYFQAIANEISFDRFIFVHFNVDRIGSYFVTSFSDGMNLAEANEITSGTSEDPFLTIDGQKNRLQAVAQAGECENQIFQDAFADGANKDLDYTHEGITAQYSSKIVSTDNRHNRVVSGIFRNENDNQCLILTFSLKNPVDSLTVVQDDRELEDRLIFELHVTMLIPQQ